MNQSLSKNEIPSQIIKILGSELKNQSHYELAGQAGSGRYYYRLPLKSGQTKVLMSSPSIDDDFVRFVAIQKILTKCSIRVPEIHYVDETEGFILLEDLGEETLHSLIQGASAKDRVSLYSEVVESLAKGHLSAIHKTQGEPLLHDRHFDFLDLRLESSYFTEWCLEKRFPDEDWQRIEVQRAFDALAIDVQDHPWDLMHRDFQSQNVMRKDGEWAWIDFQGARIGSTWYDLASLLWDPYVCLPVDEVKQHFEAYSEHRKFTGMLQWDHFLEASLQRVMQACGAYGFLTESKGLSEYESYKEKGWSQLQKILELCPDHVRLKSILLEN